MFNSYILKMVLEFIIFVVIGWCTLSMYHDEDDNICFIFLPFPWFLFKPKNFIKSFYGLASYMAKRGLNLAWPYSLALKRPRIRPALI
jgi:hypothetical protein